MRNAVLVASIALGMLSGPALAFFGSPTIPKEHIVSVDDLYGKWQEVREKKSKAVLLDVRTSEEFASGHVPGAINIPIGSQSLVPKRWPDTETEIWVYCRTQNRSAKFGSDLLKRGYRNVRVVNGGITNWVEKGYPIDRRL
ncbi:MAG: rhodanese-like domain-containing protein [Thermodesulfobacteriota bacterium]